MVCGFLTRNIYSAAAGHLNRLALDTELKFTSNLFPENVRPGLKWAWNNRNLNRKRKFQFYRLPPVNENWDTDYLNFSTRKSVALFLRLKFYINLCRRDFLILNFPCFQIFNVHYQFNILHSHKDKLNECSVALSSLMCCCQTSFHHKSLSWKNVCVLWQQYAAAEMELISKSQIKYSPIHSVIERNEI